MSVWKKTKFMLGLAADEEYDDGTEQDAPVVPKAAPKPQAPKQQAPPQQQQRQRPPAQTPAAPPRQRSKRPRPKPANPPSGSRQPGMAHPPRAGGQRSVVRPIPAATNAKPHVVAPLSFNDAQEIGDKYKEKIPVIVNLEIAERDVTRRLIDFASGLCYGLGGRMEKVSDHVYMLVPTDVEVSAEERQRLRDQGLHDE